MRLNQPIFEATQRLVADCGLDTASIFFCDHASGVGSLSYLHHVAITSEAQFAYRHHALFRHDPFVALTRACPDGRGPGFVRWGDPRLDGRDERSRGYHEFLGQHGVAVVGALGRRVSSQVSLIIGTHRSPQRRHCGEVPILLLESRLNALSEMVVDSLFEELLSQDATRKVLWDEAIAPPFLAERETQITAMICEGLRNKEIAWQLGISEYTVENHLRRIYRKLNIHNRAALVARYSGQRH